MVEKIKPLTSIEYSQGNDGWDAHNYIEYRCPKCYRVIRGGYKSETACDECGTFYDWGDKKPKIVTTKSVKW